MKIKNQVVYNALGAQNAVVSEKDAVAAYRKGCAKFAERIYAGFRDLDAFVAASHSLYEQQPPRFKKWIDDVLSIELSLKGIIGEGRLP